MFTEIQNELHNYSDEKIVVEGKLDKTAIEKLGFMNVLAISGKPLNEIVERVASCGSVAILTDYDEDGVKKAAQLTRLLQSMGVKVNFLLMKSSETWSESKKMRKSTLS